MNRLAPFFAAFCIRFASISVLPLLFVLAASVLFVPPLQAESNSSASMSISNLTITPTAGTVVFDAPWTTEAFAQAQNSFGGFDQQFNSGLGTLVQANAMTQFATGQALADPINLVLNGSATVNLNNPSGLSAASSTGISDMYTTFRITGGTGPVNVTFSAMLNSLQSLMTTGGGILASSEVIFALTINGNVVLFRDSPLMIGANSSLELPIFRNLDQLDDP